MLLAYLDEIGQPALDFTLKVPPAGFEPATDGVETRCSNPLSYGGR